MILLVLFWPKIIVFCEYKQKGKSRGLIKEDETGSLWDRSWMTLLGREGEHLAFSVCEGPGLSGLVPFALAAPKKGAADPLPGVSSWKGGDLSKRAPSFAAALVPTIASFVKETAARSQRAASPGAEGLLNLGAGSRPGRHTWRETTSPVALEGRVLCGCNHMEQGFSAVWSLSPESALLLSVCFFLILL